MGRGHVKKGVKADEDHDCRFVGTPIPDGEARRRWPARYPKKPRQGNSITNGAAFEYEDLLAKCHYERAEVEGFVYNLHDDVYVKAETGKPDYIGRIVEFFEAIDGEYYFTAQWFFRVEDTIIGSVGDFHDRCRVFLSDEKNDNVLDCIVSKIKIVQRDPEQKGPIPSCDLYYNMSYSVPYSSFTNLSKDKSRAGSEESSTVSFEDAVDTSNEETLSEKKTTVLDLYSGCGAMSTGLCHGAHLAGLNIETMWAVDMNKDACRSLQLNHSEAKVRNENAEHFLALLKEWEKLCEKYSGSKDLDLEETMQEDNSEDNDDADSDEEFVVEKLLDICYGDPAKIGKDGIKFKVRWKGYGSDEDTWEPIENLGKCEERMGNFVRWGMKTYLLPLPGDVDAVCGGPPCQGISGFNRFRNSDNPLDDEKNRQMVTYMDIVDHLKPKYVLMENVVDILKFSKGFLGRYALSFLVSRNYQARLGIMAAGCYGLPQFRLRAFFWGSDPYKMLPQFPLPTHDVVFKCGAPTEFERNVVAYDENQPRVLEKALVIEDALSDLPSVTLLETRDQLSYGKAPQTEFQRYIRASKSEIMCSKDYDAKKSRTSVLYDHCSLQLSKENYSRICQIPRRKGACFRDLPGVIVLPDNSTQRDPSKEMELLPSGKPLVPNFCFTYENGKSLRPFGRLWWDETVPTVLTTAGPHFQAILHPEQDRVLTVRENARLQGFPDFYRFSGTIKERYCQIGNAVAIPVSRALGYAMGVAWPEEAGPKMNLSWSFRPSSSLFTHPCTNTSQDLLLKFSSNLLSLHCVILM
uniref:DNA (cytosine-5-)-methyltransferase n=1 Tax=Posidonia oceanica TaxID=55489 RepID=G4XDS4_POSOC|nr:CMT-type DNA-methyltransferase [Posidonia oceanica]